MGRGWPGLTSYWAISIAMDNNFNRSPANVFSLPFNSRDRCGFEPSPRCCMQDAASSRQPFRRSLFNPRTRRRYTAYVAARQCPHAALQDMYHGLRLQEIHT
jgi:4'-phosphopantetheinyl transferase EntD